jgi:hypothetical protein
MNSAQITEYVDEAIARTSAWAQHVETMHLSDSQIVAIKSTGESLYELEISRNMRVAYVLNGDAAGFHMEWFRYLHGANAEYRESGRDRRASEREYNRIARIVDMPEIHNSV